MPAYPSVAPEAPVDRALRLAARVHGRQRRKDGRTPFLVHPVGVMRFLATDLAVRDADILAAAVLHDVLEDTSLTRVEVAQSFGPRVARIVEELTVPPKFHGPSVPDSTKTRVLVERLEQSSWSAVLVKLADRFDNLGDIANANWDARKRRAYRAQTRALMGVIRRRWRLRPPPRRLSAPIRAALAALERRLGPDQP